MATALEKLKQWLESPLFRETMDILEEGVLVVDLQCNILFYNKTLVQQEELRPEQVIGKSICEVFPSLKPEESTMHQVLKTGEPRSEQYQCYFNFEGKMIRTLNTTVPLIFDGELVGALEVSRDVSVIMNLTERLASLQQDVERGERPSAGRYHFSDIIGHHPKVQEIIALLRRVAKTSSSVLIYGETGSGKELFAQSIHQEGARSSKPFIAQNCAALPESILEALLFGTTRGSFTGAIDKAGLFEQAGGGTLLLDEVNSMSSALQAKLLRVLQEGMVRRLGGNHDIPVDVKVIATTNERPELLVKQGRLREDLFYRLSVIYVEIPPLRERVEDIEELLQHFILKYNRRFGKNVIGIHESLLPVFKKYSWPGNVRELEHVVEALMNFADSGEIRTEQFRYLGFGAFRRYVEESGFWGGTVRQGVDDYERRLIIQALRDAGGNVALAARKMGMKRQALQYRMRKFELSREEAMGKI